MSSRRGNYNNPAQRSHYNDRSGQQSQYNERPSNRPYDRQNDRQYDRNDSRQTRERDSRSHDTSQQQQHTQSQPQSQQQTTADAAQLTQEATEVLEDSSSSSVVLFIRNLPKDITGKQLMFSLFADDGDHILSVNIHKHSVTGQSLGTAECIIDSVDVAQRLVYRYHNAIWDNQTLKLSILTDESVQHDTSNDTAIPDIIPPTTMKPVYSSIVTQPVMSKQQAKANRPSLVNNPIPIPTTSTTPATTTNTNARNGSSKPNEPARQRLVISKNGKPITGKQSTPPPQQRKVITKQQQQELAKNSIKLSSGKVVVKRSRSEAEIGTGHHKKQNTKK